MENMASEAKEASQAGPFLVIGSTRPITLFLEFRKDAFPVTDLQTLLQWFAISQHLSSPVNGILFK